MYGFFSGVSFLHIHFFRSVESTFPAGAVKAALVVSVVFVAADIVALATAAGASVIFISVVIDVLVTCVGVAVVDFHTVLYQVNQFDQAPPH